MQIGLGLQASSARRNLAQSVPAGLPGDTALALVFSKGQYFQIPSMRPLSGLDGWSFTRTGARTEIAADGSLTLFDSGVPSVLPGEGLKVSAGGVNIVGAPEDFTDAAWLMEGGVSRDGTVSGPVPGYSAQRFTRASGNGRVQQSVSITTNRHTVFAIARPISPFNYICVRLPLGAGGAWVTLAVDFDDLSVAQSSSHQSNISLTALDDGYALIRFEFVSETAANLAFYFFGTDSIGVNAGNFSQPSQAGSFDLALLSAQEGVHTSSYIPGDGSGLSSAGADEAVIDLGLQWALKDAVTALDVGAYGAGSVAGATVLDDDFSGHVDQAAAEAAGYQFLGETPPTFNAANDRVDFPADNSALLRIDGAFNLVQGETYTVEAVIEGRTTGAINIEHPGNTDITPSVESNGPLVGTFTYDGSGAIQFDTSPSFDGSIDSITIRRAIPDRSASGNAAVINGTLTAAEVASGSDLLALRGFTANNYLEASYSSNLDMGTGDFAVFVWAKGVEASDGMIEFTDATFAGGWRLLTIADGVLRFSVGDGTATRTVDGPANFASDTWAMAVAVKRGDDIEIWVNGQLKGTTDASVLGDIGDPGHFLRIGLYPNATGPLQGSITLPRIIKGRAPSAREIEVLYAKERTYFEPDATLPGYAVYPGAQSWDNCGGLNPQDGFTVVVEGLTNTVGSTIPYLFEIGGGSGDQRVLARFDSTDVAQVIVVSAGVQTKVQLGQDNPQTEPALVGVAVRFRENDFAASLDGDPVQRNLTGYMPDHLALMRIAGRLNTSVSALDGVVPLIYITPPKSDAELPTLVGGSV
jgi:hypothetical protein